jgi:hypothetical protein
VSRRVPDRTRPYWVEAYYGPGGRASRPGLPNRGRPGELEGDLAIATVHADKVSRDMELRALRSRTDIGRVDQGENPAVDQ